jgi:hypothetical protein
MPHKEKFRRMRDRKGEKRGGGDQDLWYNLKMGKSNKNDQEADMKIDTLFEMETWKKNQEEGTEIAGTIFD